MTITRRHIMTGLAAAGFTATLPRLSRADIAALAEAARKEGSVTWYIAQVDTETAEAMGRAFTAKYPGVTVAVIRTTGQVAYERLLQDLKNNAPQCDVFSGTDIAQYPALKKRNQLANYTPAGAATLLPAFNAGRGSRLLVSGHVQRASADLQHAQKVTAAEAPENLARSAGPEMERPRRHRPSGVFSGCTGIWALALRKNIRLGVSSRSWRRTIRASAAPATIPSR